MSNFQKPRPRPTAACKAEVQPAAVEADSRFRVTGVSNRKTDADTTDLIGSLRLRPIGRSNLYTILGG
jgi:hypothetical protein